MAPGQLPLFILLALLAEILGTVGGFGSSLFFVPLAGYFLDFHSVLGITALFHVSSNLTKIAFFRQGFDKTLGLYIGIPAVVFVIAGAYLTRFLNTKVLEIALSVFLILLSAFLLAFRHIKLKATHSNSILGGMLSGMLAGLVGTGGAIRGITLAAFDLKMEAFIATSAAIDLCIDSSRSVVYYLNGYVQKEILPLVPVLLGVSIAGTYIGKKILMHISEAQFKSIVLILVLITGVSTLARAIYLG